MVCCWPQNKIWRVKVIVILGAIKKGKKVFCRISNCRKSSCRISNCRKSSCRISSCIKLSKIHMTLAKGFNFTNNLCAQMDIKLRVITNPVTCWSPWCYRGQRWPMCSRTDRRRLLRRGTHRRSKIWLRLGGEGSISPTVFAQKIKTSCA